jgi:hypothetical protein
MSILRNATTGEPSLRVRRKSVSLRYVPGMDLSLRSEGQNGVIIILIANAFYFLNHL